MRVSIGGLGEDLRNFQMVPIPIFSGPTYSTSSQHDILKVSKKIGHKLLVGRVKLEDGVPGGFTFWFLVGFGLVLLPQHYWADGAANIYWLTLYHQHVYLIVYFITNIVPAHVAKNVMLSMLIKCPNLHAILAHRYKSKSPCIHTT
jgi:hypothetical protein